MVVGNVDVVDVVVVMEVLELLVMVVFFLLELLKNRQRNRSFFVFRLLSASDKPDLLYQ